MPSFPIQNTSKLDLADFEAIVDFMEKNGDVSQVKHFAKEAFGIEATDPDRKTKLAQGLLRVSRLYDAGAIVEGLDAA